MRIIAAAIGGIVVAVALPAAGAFYLADRASVKAEEERVALLAEGLLRHIEKASTQANDALEFLADSAAPPKCSPASIAALRSLELSASYVQALGFMEDGRLVCTGRGLRAGPPLPPPDYTSARGFHIRREVLLEGIPDQHFVVVEDTLTGMAGVIHGNLGFDLLDHMPGLSTGVVSRAAGEVIVHRGHLDEGWLSARGPDDGYTLLADGWVVRLFESAEFDYGVYAALRLPPLAQRLKSTAIVFIPIGIVVSAILVLLIVMVARSQLSLPASLLVALKRGEIHVLYQPIVDMRTRAWVGAEALVRWRRHDGRVVLPDVFIPIAEDSGVIRQLTERVFELVLRDVAPLVARGGAFHIGINVSAADLQSERTVELVRRQVEAAGDSGLRIVVEATERGLIDEARCRHTIQAIRQAGAAIAIDDFGTGYSSLSYLGTFELDCLKIDKSFVDTIGTDSPTSDVVQHIIDIARTLRLAAVAEGVETEAQAHYLAERGVEYAQGWLFGRPMPMADLLEQLPLHTQTPSTAQMA